MLHSNNFTLKQCCTQTMLHSNNITLKQCYTETMLYSNNVTLKQCYTKTMLHSNNVTLEQCYTQTMLPSNNVTLKQCYTQTMLHSNNVTLKQCYTQTMLHSNNVTLKQTLSWRTGTTDYTVRKIKVCIGSCAPHCRSVLQNWQDKASKVSPKKQSIMEYSPGLPQETMSLRSCSLEIERWCFSKVMLKSSVLSCLNLQHRSVNS